MDDRRLIEVEQMLRVLDDRTKRLEDAWYTFQHNHFKHLVSEVNQLQLRVSELCGGVKTLKWFIPLVIAVMTLIFSIITWLR